ncbi:MAG: branched-chain amino acid ABC transporter permease [Actinomycetota bacterium]|nr:branched-chain amino acid ABC transporter permease [Actinomycetota bacterium]
MRVRLSAIAAALFVAVFASFVLVGPAQATAPSPSEGAAAPKCKRVKIPSKDDVIQIVGQLSDTRTDPCTPVSGVKISVEDEEGGVIGEATSADDGTFVIPLPGAAIDNLGTTVTVKIDEGSLPEGSVLTDPKDVSNTKRIVIEGNISFTFPIGPDPNPPTPVYQQVLQLTVSGLIFSFILALGALGLSMIFGTTGLTNFAHGELITFGALVAYGFDSGIGLTVIVAGIIAVVVSGGFGWAQDSLLWRPLRRRGTGLIAMMIVSIGLSIFLRSLYQYFAGADNHNYSQYATVTPWSLGPIDLTPKEFIVTLLAIVVLVVVTQALQRTRMGKATRAVADNPALASSSGINVDRVISVVWIGGAALAGLSGFMLGLTQGFDYQLGFKILLLVFAAVTLGGLGTIWGAILGSLVVGVFIELSTLVIPSELKFAGAFAVLIVVLLFRPQGLLGRAERVG